MAKTIRLMLCGVASVVLGVSAVQAEQHEGDVQPWLEGGKIQVNANLFEANFGDLPGGLYSTDDPGYDADTAKGAFGANNYLWFEGLGTLKFWNGSSWGAPTAGETVRIDDVLGNTSVFGGAGITTSQGVIDQLDGAGDLHSHLDMSVYTSGGSLGGTVGAYWITLRLFETAAGGGAAVSTPSDPYSFVFNRGLSTEAFETAVAAVPLPAAIWLFATALAGMTVVGRRNTAIP